MDNNTPSFSIDLNTCPMHNIPCETPPPQELIQELSRMKSENKKLNDLLTTAHENYYDLLKKNNENDLSNMRKRSCCDEWPLGSRLKDIKSTVSRIHVRVDPSDMSLAVKDGYHWRKYGQKVTRDNPSPRAYYKCSFAPTCPVKKKVQRSATNPHLLEATYEGQHNHHLAETSVAVYPGSIPFECSTTAESLDLKDPIACSRIQSAFASRDSGAFPKYFVEQMVSLLTKNPSFTDALAAAITSRILDDAVSEHNDSESDSKLSTI